MILTLDAREMPAGVGASIPQIGHQYLRRAKDLQVLRGVAMQALQLAKSPDCEISKIAAVIEQDIKLASDVLRMANSAVFGASKSVSSLRPAVVRLGLGQIQNLIVSASMASLMRRLSSEDEWTFKLLWRHSVTTAGLAQQINRTLRLGFQGEEFSAGLFHDIGRTLFAVCMPQQFAEIDPLEFDESDFTLIQETNISGASHCELGSWYLTDNRLPAEMAEVARYHHHPRLASGNRRLVALTAVCDHMANHLQRAETFEDYDVESNPFIGVLESCDLPDIRSHLEEVAMTVMEATQRNVSEMIIL